MYKSTDGRAAIGAVAFDFYRCKRCTRLVTQPELARTLQANTGSACPCGGTTYAPTNLWDPLESTCRHASLSIL